MTTRKYSSRAQQTTLSSGITSSDTTMTVGSGSNLMGGKTPAVGETYTVVIDPDTALEEIVDVSNYASGNTLTIARGIDGSTGVAHSAGAIVRHMVIGRDLSEANTHVNGTLAQHTATTSAQLAGIISDETGSGSLVFATSPTLVTPVLGVATATSINGTTIPSSATLVKTSDTGTITGTMIANDTIVNADINSAAAIAYSKLNLTGAVVNTDITNDTITNAKINTAAAIDWTKLGISSTVSSTEIGYVDGVTSAIQTQIDSKLATTTAASTYAPLASPALTGVPTAPTAAANTNTTQVATTAYVQTELTDLIGGAPGALDTLNELATALANDASYSTTITTALAGKLALAGGTMTGAIAMGNNKITGLGTPTASGDAVTKAYADAALVGAPGNLTGPITSVGAVTSIASQTGTGTKFVVDTSPTLVTPVLGVATATSINGTTIPSTKTLVVTTDKISALAATTSAELASVISDETGSGALVFGTSPTLVTPVLGTPTSVTLTNATGLPVSGITASTTTALGVGSVELGHATDTTLARVSAGVVSIEGVNVVTTSSTDTLTNKTLTSPTSNTATINNPVIKSPEERYTISATAATGTVAFDTQTQGVLYYTSNASANFTLNFTNVNANLATGDSISCVFLVTNGSTAYYPTAFQVDSVAVTPKWSGGVAPSAGNASAIDSYSFTIIKTASTPTYTVLAGGAVKFS
jgi:hypothetical protein